MNVTDRLSSATLDEIKQGYTESAEAYTCLCCGHAAEKGVIYPVGDRLYDARRYIGHHVKEAHGSVFAWLVGLDKSVHGLSDLQRRLLALFYEGRTDEEIRQAIGAGSTSTVRNHRFILKEKERQARVFLAIMALLQERQGAGGESGTSSARQRSRAEKPADERERILARYFPHGLEGPLQHFSGRTPEKHRRLIAAAVAERFVPGRRYSEREVNEVLESIAEDYVLLRRCLVDFGHLRRLPDGSQYWRSDENPQRGNPVDRRKELKRLAREAKTEGGVFQIRNIRNGMIWIGTTPNFRTLNGQRFQLENGSHMSRELQQAWDEFGPDAFVFEPLETLEVPETGYFDRDVALKKLKQKWLRKLQPFGDRSYNLPRELEEEAD